jgi:hypothetical protein
VDARLHYLQGKAEYVTDPVQALQDFYRDKLEDVLRHEAGARLIAQYDVNNTYQYIINREETQLSWIARAIVDLGGAVPEEAAEQTSPGRRERRVEQRVLEEDIRHADAFVDRWRPRVEEMTDARHRGMLRVILGETLEQKRFFEQALAGRTDLLGRRTDGVGPLVGEVLPTRWIE